MMEIPESHNMALQATQALAGKTIASVQAAQSPHGFAWYYEDPAHYPQLLTGRRIEGAAGMASFLRLNAGGAQMLFNDGTNLRYVVLGGKLPAKHQLLLTFDDGSHLVCTVQMYGGLMAFPAGAYDNEYYRAAREKPSPLSADFDEDHFQNLFRQTPEKYSVKAFLATEQRIPGLGNGCLQDILFAAGVNPQSRLYALSMEEVEALFRCTKGVLKEMAKKGGRDTEKNLFGEKGGYVTILSRNTAKFPCPVCGGEIVKKAFLGGNVYYCPRCQPLKK